MGGPRESLPVEARSPPSRPAPAQAPRLPEVIGVSFDSWESHHRFQERCGLGFALAADPDRSIAQAYGVGRMPGLLPVARRSSFLVGPDGRIAEVWPSVNPKRHAAEVLEAVRRHAGAGAATPR